MNNIQNVIADDKFRRKKMNGLWIVKENQGLAINYKKTECIVTSKKDSMHYVLGTSISSRCGNSILCITDEKNVIQKSRST